MSTPPQPKYFLLRLGMKEEGPFSLAQINRMASHGQVEETDGRRVEGQTEVKPIKVVFPHLARREPVDPAARRIEYRNPRTALGPVSAVCGALCWLPIPFYGWMLAVIALVLGIHAWR